MSERKRSTEGRSSAVGAADALETLVNQFSDPLVFLRELVQNSLDAASTRIDVDFAFDGHELMTIAIADNGEGMNEGIIDRYLLTLFSSTKENDLTKIGKFGVGFVSIFAIAPDLIVLDTGQAGESWRLIFHPNRKYEKRTLSEPVEGTTIALHKRVTNAEFADIQRRGKRTVAYWCKYAEAEILVDGEPIGEPFGVRAHLSCIYDEPGTSIAIGFADTGNNDDATSRPLPGVASDGASQPIFGFYNRGLTLVESREPPNPESREARFLAGLSVRVKSRYLEHTLTRDNVRQDENYAKAMKRVRKHVEGALRTRLLEHLQALAKHVAGEVEDPGAPNFDTALRYARLPSMALHESAAHAKILPTIHGDLVSVDDVRRANSPTGTPLRASERSPVTACLRELNVPVVLDRPAIRAHLNAIVDGIERDEDGEVSRVATQVLITAQPIELSEQRAACVREAARLLRTAKVKFERLMVGDLAYPGSIVATRLYIRQEQAFELTVPGRDDQVTWLGGARDIVLNQAHSLVSNALVLAEKNTALAAQIVAQAICIAERCDAHRAVNLARTCLQSKRTATR